VGSASFDVGSWITLRWTLGTRYYRVHLEQDLWTGWLLTQVHGRIGSRLAARDPLSSPQSKQPFLACRHRQTPTARGYQFDA
jgi:hypothetical protein